MAFLRRTYGSVAPGLFSSLIFDDGFEIPGGADV
jgi:hypothetical protein